MITIHGCGKAGYMVYTAAQSLNMDGFIQTSPSTVQQNTFIQTKIANNSLKEEFSSACHKMQNKIYPAKDTFLKS